MEHHTSWPRPEPSQLRASFSQVQWQYMTVIEHVNMPEHLDLQLNALGSLGWEAVAMTASDPTLGLNQVHVLLKRAAPDWPPPASPAAAWVQDPTGRYAQRYWDGIRWTEHVSAADGARTTDFPNVR